MLPYIILVLTLVNFVAKCETTGTNQSVEINSKFNDQPANATSTEQLTIDQQLSEAVENGDVNQIRELLKIEFDVFKNRLLRAEYGDSVNMWHILHYAAHHGNPDIVEFIIKSGHDVNSCNAECQTPLMVAAKNESEEAVKILLQNGANINLIDNQGWTALHHAAAVGSKAIINLLLDAGADINVLTNKHQTPLMLAAASQQGTDLRFTKGTTKHMSWGGLLGNEFHVDQMQLDAVKTLLDRDAYTNTIDNEGRTLLGSARMSGSAAMMNLILQNSLNKTAEIDQCFNNRLKDVVDFDTSSMENPNFVHILNLFMTIVLDVCNTSNQVNINSALAHNLIKALETPIEASKDWAQQDFSIRKAFYALSTLTAVLAGTAVISGGSFAKDIYSQYTGTAARKSLPRMFVKPIVGIITLLLTYPVGQLTRYLNYMHKQKALTESKDMQALFTAMENLKNELQEQVKKQKDNERFARKALNKPLA